jgi:hypothetical protein
MLVFSKLPLRMAEVVEGLATFRTREGDDMRPDHAQQDVIIRFLPSLIYHDSATDLVLLSHSTVVNFLLDSVTLDSSNNSDAITSFVDHSIIRTICLRCLRQPRYKPRLGKSTDGGSKMHVIEYGAIEADSHKLLLYAAKYCFQHFNCSDGDPTPGPKQPEIDALNSFIPSPKFLTCVQLQCL